MAYDLFLGQTKVNVARGGAEAQPSSLSEAAVKLEKSLRVYWPKSSPVAIDRNSFGMINFQGMTVLGKPALDVWRELHRDSKITLQTSGLRVFIKGGSAYLSYYPSLNPHEKAVIQWGNHVEAKVRKLVDLVRKGDPEAKKIYAVLKTTGILRAKGALVIGRRSYTTMAA
jgi:hypothetical protein